MDANRPVLLPDGPSDVTGDTTAYRVRHLKAHTDDGAPHAADDEAFAPGDGADNPVVNATRERLQACMEQMDRMQVSWSDTRPEM